MSFPLRMVHPYNGATHAHDNSEAERLRAIGWVEEVQRSEPTEEAEVKRGPGRPRKVAE